MAKIATSLLLLGAMTFQAPAAAATPAPTGAERIKAAAESCGLPLDALDFGRDAAGDYADISPHGDSDRIHYQSLFCLVKWAAENHARVGFVSEPPPQVIAFGPLESVRAAAQAARDCKLPVHLDALNPEEAVLDARADAPAAELACARSWIDEHWVALGLRPVQDLQRTAF
ncbi:MAG: hypothetical protein E6G94_12315 [Alphaproteobacteria bacterium]|nr:MAG: hypothetical protein E6G94_12315 [Alphaproteobacteria bacterium]